MKLTVSKILDLEPAVSSISKQLVVASTSSKLGRVKKLLMAEIENFIAERDKLQNEFRPVPGKIPNTIDFVKYGEDDKPLMTEPDENGKQHMVPDPDAYKGYMDGINDYLKLEVELTFPTITMKDLVDRHGKEIDATGDDLFLLEGIVIVEAAP